MQRHILLIGFMGVGKSTISAVLSRMLETNEVDTDQMIAEREGLSVSDIFKEKGEEYFRARETELLQKLGGMEPMIISCGGGMALRSENAALMKAAGNVVWLTAEPETILERVKDDDSRPLLRGRKNVAFIAELLEKRREKYEAASDIAVATDHRPVEEICREIIKQLQ